MRTRPLTFFLSIASLVALGACSGRCSPKKTDAIPDATAPIPSATSVSKDELLPPPAPWTFKQARVGPGMPGVALPEGCRMRAPLVRATVAPSTRFVAIPSATGSLVVADADTKEASPRLVGVAGVLLDPEGQSKDATPLPWQDADAMPRITRTAKGEWLAAYAEQGEDKLSSVFVFKKNAITPIGTGDRFDAVDLACGASSCALLTTRLGGVAAAGADVWLGGQDESAASWRRLELAPSTGDSDARPSCIARVDASADGKTSAFVALLEKQELVFWEAAEQVATREIGRVPAPFGMVDAIVTEVPSKNAGPPARLPIALVYGSPIDEEGCAREGGKLRFERPSEEAVEIRAQAPPISGSLRPLARGTLATYLAPLGCGVDRKVAYALVLDEKGSPISPPMPVSDASHFAVAAHGEDVDLWIQLGDEVTWVRASCAAP